MHELQPNLHLASAEHVTVNIFEITAFAMDHV